MEQPVAQESYVERLVVLKNTVGLLNGLLALLLQQHLLNVGQDSSGCNGDTAQKLVELLVVANGELR